MSRPLSYAQNYEDLHLDRVFADQPDGFYIDIGAGHPVHSNVSFLFYLRGWRGITVEPNPWLAQLSEAVRPRDRRIDSLVGAQSGQAMYHLVEGYHGLSTTVEANAQAAQKEFQQPVKSFPVQVTTLRALAREHAPAGIDFLKIDVEGAEQSVLEGNDWARCRPKVIVAEAVAPITLEPAWDAWEPILIANGYRFAFSDGLNRYYTDEDRPEIGAALSGKPPSFKRIPQIGSYGRALEDTSHPDHALAQLLKSADMVRLPLLGAAAYVRLLTASLPAAELEQPATAAAAATISRQLLGDIPIGISSTLHRNATIRDVYAALVVSEQFRAACGRISASYAW